VLPLRFLSWTMPFCTPSFDCPGLHRFCVLLLFLVMGLALGAWPKDVVVMKNGDHLTGTVKKLENGILYIDTDYFSDTTGVDWFQVETIRTTSSFQVILKNGERVAGTIEKEPSAEAPGKDFQIHTGTGQIRADSADVVNLASQKRTFWRQLKGSIDFGIDFTSGNSQTSLSSDGNATYQTTRWMAGASYNTSFSGQSGGATTNTIEGQTLDGLFLSRNSFLAGLADLLHSSQQDLALRVTTGGGYGRYWFRTNYNSFAWILGAAYIHENYFPSAAQSADQHVVALIGAEYQLFHFTRYNLQSQVFVYPGLSDPGRILLTTKSTFTVKLRNNFYTDVSFWDNFNSNPPSNSKGNEMGISNSIGWTF
jgi:Protein of unknown function, DUF481